jgi:hypothetical protein
MAHITFLFSYWMYNYLYHKSSSIMQDGANAYKWEQEIDKNCGGSYMVLQFYFPLAITSRSAMTL